MIPTLPRKKKKKKKKKRNISVYINNILPKKHN